MLVRGGAAGVRALLKQAQGRGVRGSLAKAAERFLRRQVDLEESSPFDRTPTARAEHAARMSEAQVALSEGTTLPRRGPDLGAAQSPWRGMRRLSGNPAVFPKFQK